MGDGLNWRKTEIQVSAWQKHKTSIFLSDRMAVHLLLLSTISVSRQTSRPDPLIDFHCVQSQPEWVAGTPDPEEDATYRYVVSRSRAALLEEMCGSG